MSSVLVIDDSPDLRRLLTRALANEGHTVHTAEDGKQGIERLGTIQPPCVILLDLMMPVMDGLEFLKWKNSQPKIANWPVIILSASTHSDLPSGAKAFLKKPVDLDELLQLMDENC